MATRGEAEPGYAAKDVNEVYVWQPVVRPLRNWVEGSSECEDDGERGDGGEEQRSAGEVVVALEVEGKRDSGETVGGEEAVDGEGAHPAIDVGSGDAAKSEDCYRERGEDAGDEDS